MFTGIVEAVGTIREAVDAEATRRFVVEAPDFAGALSQGESIAVDGACLTAISIDGDTFGVDVIGTTLQRTIAGRYAAGARVNLERAVRIDARLDGHLVQGHVDGVGELIEIREEGEYWLMDFRIPTEVAGTTILHGSITLNGVSLTVSDLTDPDRVRVGIIPFTHAQTNLGSLEVGDPVNVEGDLVGKYVERILALRGRGDAGRPARAE